MFALGTNNPRTRRSGKKNISEKELTDVSKIGGVGTGYLVDGRSVSRVRQGIKKKERTKEIA